MVQERGLAARHADADRNRRRETASDIARLAVGKLLSGGRVPGGACGAVASVGKGWDAL